MQEKLTKIFIICFILFSSCTAICQSQTAENEEGVTVCKTQEDIKKAKARGDLFLKIGSEYSARYFVRVGMEYKGPFRSLKSAKKVLELYQKEAKESGTNLDNYMGSDVVHNPSLLVFPFVEVSPQKELLFSVPGGMVVNASKIMIHPEPFLFEEVNFGRIYLGKRGYFFAATGKMVSRAVVDPPTSALKLWIGAAVIGAEGKVLWRNYGEVSNDLSFKNIERLKTSNEKPEFVIVFMLAEGKMKEMLRPMASIPDMDASPYEYHILASAALEIGPNWFPPVEPTVQSEYQKALKDYEKKHLEDRFKKKSP